MKLERTQIYLEKTHYEALKQEARASDLSLAELIRRIVKDHLVKGGRMKGFSKDRYMSIVGIGKSGSTDISSRHDEYLGKALGSGHSD